MMGVPMRERPPYMSFLGTQTAGFAEPSQCAQQQGAKRLPALFQHMPTAIPTTPPHPHLQDIANPLAMVLSAAMMCKYDLNAPNVRRDGLHEQGRAGAEHGTAQHGNGAQHALGG